MKTKLGISFGLAASALCFLYLFGGVLTLAVATVYVLLMEENQWLKHYAVKAVAVACSFSAISLVAGLVPTGLSLLHSLLNLVDISFNYSDIRTVMQYVVNLVDFAEKIMFLNMGMKALKLETVPVQKIDNLLAQHFILEE